MGTLLNLQRGVLPNIYPLKKLIKWFDAVSLFLDNFTATNPTFLAGALIDAAGTISNAQSYGVASVTHSGAGVYDIFLTTPVDALFNYILSATVANLGISATIVYTTGIQFVGANQIRVRIYSVSETAVVTAADHDFYFDAERLPAH